MKIGKTFSARNVSVYVLRSDCLNRFTKSLRNLYEVTVREGCRSHDIEQQYTSYPGLYCLPHPGR